MGRRAGTLAVVGVLLGPVAVPAHAAPGDLDPGFSDDGKRLVDAGGGPDRAQDVDTYPDGSVVVSGSSAAAGSSDGGDLLVVQLRPNGSSNPAFSGDGVARVDVAGADAGVAVEATADGGALVATPSAPGPGDRLTVLRFRADGSLDPGFAEDGIAAVRVDGAPAVAADMAALPGGGFVVVGRAHEEGNVDLALARFNAGGALVTSFGGDGTIRVDSGGDEKGQALALLPDGRIVVGGTWLPSANGSEHRREISFLAAVLPDGTADTSFGEDGYLAQPDLSRTGFEHIEPHPELGILAGGQRPYHHAPSFESYATPFLYPYDATGGRGADLAEDLLGYEMAGLGVDAAGGVLLTMNGAFCARFGGCLAPDVRLFRIGADGEFDPAFGYEGFVRTDFERRADSAAGLAVDRGNRVVVAGDSTGPSGSDLAVARYLLGEGPRDADADGLDSEADLCEAAYAPHDPQGCPHIGRGLTIRRAPTGYKGRIEAEYPECAAYLPVSVYRKRRGRDRFLGYSYSNRHGDYSLRESRRPGRYYAATAEAVEPTAQCGSARSRTLEFRVGGDRR